MTAAPLDPTALVAEVRRLGVILHVDDAGAIRAKPAGVLTAELRDQIRLHKDELVETLSHRMADIPGECACGRLVVYYGPTSDGGATPLCALHAPTNCEGAGLSLPKPGTVQFYLGEACATCGSDQRWQSEDGEQHCFACEAPPAQYAVPATSAQPRLPEREAVA